jgi:hypothetical protein
MADYCQSKNGKNENCIMRNGAGHIAGSIRKYSLSFLNNNKKMT